MPNDCINLVHVILVQITITPFQHLVVGHHLLKHVVTMPALEPKDGVLSISSGFTSGVYLQYLGTVLFSFIIGIGDECPPHKSFDVNDGKLVLI